MNPLAATGPSVSHFGFAVRDVARMEDFYKRVMGFIVTDRGELDTPRGRVYLVFLSRDPEEHHQVVLCSGRPADESYNIINQISFKVPSLAFLRDLYTRVAAEPGVTEVAPATHGNAISLYFRDPEGTRIECFIDSPWYCEQPCRVAIDLTQSEAEILAACEKVASTSPRFMPRAQWVADMRRKMEAGIHA